MSRLRKKGRRNKWEKNILGTDGRMDRQGHKLGIKFQLRAPKGRFSVVVLVLGPTHSLSFSFCALPCPALSWPQSGAAGGGRKWALLVYFVSKSRSKKKSTKKIRVVVSSAVRERAGAGGSAFLRPTFFFSFLRLALRLSSLLYCERLLWWRELVHCTEKEQHWSRSNWFDFAPQCTGPWRISESSHKLELPVIGRYYLFIGTFWLMGFP